MGLHIVQIASELTPIAKAGGLGDVVYGLSRALLKLGHSVEVIIPKYDTIAVDQVDGLKVHLIETPHPFFKRGKIYGEPDDPERFIQFCLATMEFLKSRKKKVDILHLHDWHTAPIAALNKGPAKTVLTIHNLSYQGRCGAQILSELRLSLNRYVQAFQDPHLPNCVNLLKGGIEFANLLTTVSPNYAKEILTPEGGCGLDALLCHRKVHGILNGIDDQFWNPATDPHLIAHYDRSLPTLLKAKAKNKKELQARLNLPQIEAPLLVSVTRLVEQKSPHLIKHALLRTLEKGGQSILLGSAASPELAAELLTLKANPNCAILLDYNEPLSHQIFAAADMTIIPSLFEPCGLTQMIALRYGTIPIVRLTGGLADTVFDGQNGFTFEHPTPEGVDWALSRALKAYHTPLWHNLIMAAIDSDFSWTRSASEYSTLYQKLN